MDSSAPKKRRALGATSPPARTPAQAPFWGDPEHLRVDTNLISSAFTIGKELNDTVLMPKFQSEAEMILSRFKIRTKLVSIVALSILAVCAIIAWSASLSQKRMLDDRVAQLRTAVDITIGMAQSLQDEVTAGRMTLGDAESEFRKHGKRMMFGNGQGYVVAYRTDTSTMMNAANPQLDGKTNNVKDANGVLIVPAVLETARPNPESGTTTYFLRVPVKPSRRGSLFLPAVSSP